MTYGGSPYFTPDNLLAIDPDFYYDGRLRDAKRTGFYISKFAALPIDISALLGLIKTGKLEGFDIIFCKGVVSVGGADYTLGKKEVIDFSEAREFALGVIPAMRDCLSSSPQALLMMCTKYGDTYLPFTEQDLSTLGLKIVKHKPPEDSDISKVDRLILRAGGYFPDDFVFYNTVICQRSSL